MKIVVDVKNAKTTNDFRENDLILFNGKEWYITTKEEILGELESVISDAIARYNAKYTKLENDFAEFRLQISQHVSDIAAAVTNLLPNPDNE